MQHPPARVTWPSGLPVMAVSLRIVDVLWRPTGVALAVPSNPARGRDMITDTPATLLPELALRPVRRGLWQIGTAVAVLYVLWLVWDNLAPWRALAFLHAAGFREVSAGAASGAIRGGASWTPLSAAALGFAIFGVVLVWVVRFSDDKRRAARRAALESIVAMLVGAAVFVAVQLHEASDAGRRLHDGLRFTQSSVNGLAGKAGVAVAVLVDVAHDSGGGRVQLPGPVLVVGGSGFGSSTTVYGYDTAHGAPFTAPSAGFQYTGGPR